ncbi:sugar transferase [Labedaea rhizosphaerae]|nr:sugar transferase [Labedaea rhizosphaerae]
MDTWETRYRRFVIAADLLGTVLGVLGVGLVIADSDAHYLRHAGQAGATVLIVVCALIASRAWHPGTLGQGAEEFRRLGKGLFAALVALALVGIAVGAHDVRPWVFVVIPAIAVLVFPTRYLLRRFLHRNRREGRCMLPVMAAGSPETIRDLVTRTRTASHLGWRVDAACTIDGLGDDETGDVVDGVPVVGHLGQLAEHVRRGGYRIVAVTPDPYWTPRRLQQLAWNLEGSEAEMVVAPVLMEVAGPRLHVSGVLGMPLLRVSAPAFTGARRVVKGAMDRIGSFLLLALLAPVFILVSAMVAVDSRGPVFYRQKRVGKDGRVFTIVKFRTMVTNADKQLATLAANNEGAGLLFKMRSDPRITRVGRVLRRYSLDELPQLFNVLGGSMSLVGPRPPLPEESARYAPDVRRRLLVKPGLTGLWQVSGRSDLSWDEAVRLDLRYVEDWSLAMDAVILWKTFRAVFTGAGAY